MTWRSYLTIHHNFNIFECHLSIWKAQWGRLWWLSASYGWISGRSSDTIYSVCRAGEAGGGIRTSLLSLLTLSLVPEARQLGVNHGENVSAKLGWCEKPHIKAGYILIFGSTSPELDVWRLREENSKIF